MAFNPFDNWIKPPLVVDVMPMTLALEVEMRLEQSQEAFLEWLTVQDRQGEGKALFRKIR